MNEWKVLKETAVIEGKHRAAPAGTWVPGGGIEPPCTSFFAAKMHKILVTDTIREAERNLAS